MSDERRTPDADQAHRMDTQDMLLREIRDMIVGHVAEHEERKIISSASAKALDEIVLLWRASKIIIPALIVIVTTVAAAWAWAKDHIK